MDPNLTPAMHPPPGVQYDLNEPNPIMPMRIAVSVITILLCFVGVTLRTYMRITILKKFNLEDCALIFATAGFITFTVFIIMAGQHGDGKHQWNVSLANVTDILLYLNIVEVLYGPTMFCAKYAVLRQIDSIFLAHRRQSLTYKAVWTLIWANLVFYLVLMFLFLFSCIPREKIWNPTMDGRCIDQHNAIVATSGINVVSDVTILVVPLVAIAKLQMPLKTKIGTAAVFAIGIFAIITSILRLYYSIELKYAEDMTWAIAPVGHWALGEFATVIIVACLPCLPRLFRHFFDKKQKSSRSFPESDITGNSNSRKARSRGFRSIESNSSTALHDEHDAYEGVIANPVALDEFDSSKVSTHNTNMV